MAEAIVQINQLTKIIDGKKIIDHISFSIERGEVFGFLGPNGAGKTTTIRMLVGLMSITEGSVLIKGKDITKDFELAIREIGGIVENPEMYKFLTGYQNLIHYARMAQDVTKDRIDEIISLVGLTERIHEKVKTYSLGMRQRLGLAQALLHRPSVLILDEPTNGLDPAGIREIRDYLRKLAQEEGLAVIVSSHLLAEMELMCDRIGIIQKGKLIDVKSVKDFINDEKEQLYRFEVSPVERALLVLEQYKKTNVNVHEQNIEITIEKAEVPKLINLFVNNEISVFSVSNIARTLEDKFLEITGGEERVY